MKILMIQYRAIGDVLLLTPVFKVLKEQLPDAHLTLMVNKGESMIVKNNPYLDDLIQVQNLPRNGLINNINYLKYSNSLAKQIRGKYDVVIDFIGNPRSAIATLLSKAPIRIGRTGSRDVAYNHKIRFEEVVNSIILRLGHLKPLGINADYCRPEIYPDSEDKAFVDDYIGSVMGNSNRPIVLLAPNSPRSSRRWRSDFFAEVGKRLVKERNAKLLLLWGPGEYEYTRNISTSIGDDAEMIPNTSLLQMAEIISRGDLLISNDGGAKHMGYAFGVNTIAIYGPTSYISWNDPDFESNPPIWADVPCIQCEKRICPKPEHYCMNEVQPGRVFDVACKLLLKEN